MGCILEMQSGKKRVSLHNSIFLAGIVSLLACLFLDKSAFFSFGTNSNIHRVPLVNWNKRTREGLNFVRSERLKCSSGQERQARSMPLKGLDYGTE